MAQRTGGKTRQRMANARDRKSRAVKRGKTKRVRIASSKETPAEWRARTLGINTWISNVEGALKFLENLDQVTAIHGDAWKANMALYYKGRLANLLAVPPKGARAFVSAYQSRYDKLLLE